MRQSYIIENSDFFVITRGFGLPKSTTGDASVSNRQDCRNGKWCR